MARFDKDNFTWTVLKRETVYKSPWISLHQDWVKLPDGSVIEGHHVIDFPRPAVGVVALDRDGRILMVDHYRFINKVRSWEIPAGGVDPDESLEAAARRELLEEGGCTGGKIECIGRYFPSNGSSNQLFFMYLISEVQQTSHIHDTNEIIDARWFSVEEVRQLLKKDEVPDGLSITALLKCFFMGYI